MDYAKLAEWLDTMRKMVGDCSLRFYSTPDGMAVELNWRAGDIKQACVRHLESRAMASAIDCATLDPLARIQRQVTDTMRLGWA